MRRKTYERSGACELEFLLVIAFLSLSFQIFPEQVSAIDIRRWPKWAWVLVNTIAIVALIAPKLTDSRTSVLRFYWVLGVGVALLLFCQLFFHWQVFVTLLDVRQWKNFAWCMATLAGIALLLLIRYGPDIPEFPSFPKSMAIESCEPEQKSPDVRMATAERPTDDLEKRIKRDREWRERAKKRLPFS